MPTEIFEFKPRFKGAPPICLRANLPYFADDADARAWHVNINPRGYMDEPYPCGACGGWHYHSLPADPGGATSGTTRTAKHRSD